MKYSLNPSIAVPLVLCDSRALFRSDINKDLLADTINAQHLKSLWFCIAYDPSPVRPQTGLHLYWEGFWLYIEEIQACLVWFTISFYSKPHVLHFSASATFTLVHLIEYHCFSFALIVHTPISSHPFIPVMTSHPCCWCHAGPFQTASSHLYFHNI